MTDEGYVPLTDEQVGAIRDDLQWRVPDVLRRILADREHYKRRAETAERLLGLVAPHACVITRHAMPSARPMAGGQVQG